MFETLCVVGVLGLLLLLGRKSGADTDDTTADDGAPPVTSAVSPEQWPPYAASLASALLMFPTGSTARQGAVTQFQIALGMPVTGIYSAAVRDRCLAALQTYDPTLTNEDLPVPELPIHA